VFFLVLAHLGSPGQMVVKRLLLLCCNCLNMKTTVVMAITFYNKLQYNQEHNYLRSTCETTAKYLNSIDIMREKIWQT